MATKIVSMPNYGMHMTEGKVETWFVEEGESVSVGDELVEIGESKALHTITSKVDGVLTKITVPEGETAEVGAELAVITTEE